MSEASKILYQYLLLLGDNSLILAHRLSELCGHGPSLETDIALTNISLDLFGQVRNYFQYAAKISGGDATEDSIAMLRLPNEYRNCLLTEQPNHDFGHVIMRQYLFDVFHFELLERLKSSADETLSAIAHKSIKEVSYHKRFSTSWIYRLSDGTEESQAKMQYALNHLWAYTGGLFYMTEVETSLIKAGIAVDLRELESDYFKEVQSTLTDATLEIPETIPYQQGGKEGIHSEAFAYILGELQFMQRTYPDMQW